MHVEFRRWRWKRWLALAGAALGVYLVVGIVLAGRGTIPTPPANVPLRFHGGAVRGNRITTKSWSFDYTRAQLSPDGTRGSVEGVRDGLVFRNGKPYLKISAQKVTLNLQSLDFTAIGRVHVEYVHDKQKRSFDTDLVIWTNDAKLMRMPHPAYIHSGTQTLRVDGISLDFDANTFHIGKLSGGVDIRK